MRDPGQPPRRLPSRRVVQGQTVRAELAARLRGRRPEIERDTLTRIYAIADPAAVGDATYADGLRAAVAAALDYGFAGIDGGERGRPTVPPILLAQARIAARSGVGLETVLRRYFAGYALFGDFLVEEAGLAGLAADDVKGLLRTQAANFDRLLEAVSEEHGREASGQPQTAERRRVEQVQRLLAGERLDPSELVYDLDCFHVAIVGNGSGAGAVVRRVVEGVDRQLLIVEPDDNSCWAWLGGRRPFEMDALAALLSSAAAPGATFALGEPGKGIAGWRLSHRQAKAALPVALRRSEQSTRYADVALIAAAIQDDLLAASLQEIYLTPLEHDRDKGATARRTLRAYFAADKNASSAAAALGATRQTVANRLQAIEERLQRRLHKVGPELQVALSVHEMGEPLANGTTGKDPG